MTNKLNLARITTTYNESDEQNERYEGEWIDMKDDNKFDINKILKNRTVWSVVSMVALSAALIGGISVFSGDGKQGKEVAVLTNEQKLDDAEVVAENEIENADQDKNTDNNASEDQENPDSQDPEADQSKEASESVTEAEDDEQTAEEMEEEAKEQEQSKDIHELLSNINFDRLGIAVVDNYLNIRKSPSESGKIIGKLPKNAGCHIYKIKNGWAKIISNGVSGWVSADYLVTDKKAEKLALEVGKRTATITEETVNIRFVPSTDSRIYTMVPVGEDLTIANENLTEKYVNKIMDDFKKSEKFLIADVNKKEMMKQLDDWICVKLNGERVFVAKELVETSYQLKKAVAIDVDAYDSKKTGISSTRSDMVNYAMQFLGNPYVWGGTSLTNGCDCSGFVMGIYSHYGYGLPRTSASQAASMYEISYSEAQPGDLFFYGNGYTVSHVAMYIGNGQIIHAMDESHGICISNAYYMSPMKIGRSIS